MADFLEQPRKRECKGNLLSSHLPICNGWALRVCGTPTPKLNMALDSAELEEIAANSSLRVFTVLCHLDQNHLFAQETPGPGYLVERFTTCRR